MLWLLSVTVHQFRSLSVHPPRRYAYVSIRASSPKPLAPMSLRFGRLRPTASERQKDRRRIRQDYVYRIKHAETRLNNLRCE
jgi:hypothetical protein